MTVPSRLPRRLPLALAAAALVAFPMMGGLAATPASGSLGPQSPDLKWTGGPLNGGGAVIDRQDTCVEGTDCDAIAVNVGGLSSGWKMDITLTPDDGNSQMEMLVYPPGTDLSGHGYTGPDSEQSVLDATNASNVRTVEISDPADGQWHLRATCTACANTTYHAEALASRVTATNPLAGLTLPQPAANSLGYSFATVPYKDTPGGAGEPQISINARGDEVANTFGPTLWTSHNNGRTWSNAINNVESLSTLCGSEDSDAVYANDGTIYADNLCQAGFEDTFYYSHDNGATWNADKMALPSVAGLVSDRQWITADPKNPQIVYLEFHSIAPDNDIWVYKSTDGGGSFTPTSITLSPSNPGLVDNTAEGNVTSRLLIDPHNDQNLYVLWGQTTTQEGVSSATVTNESIISQIYIASSTDQGATWTVSQAFDDGGNFIAHIFVADAIDDAGNIYEVFSEHAANDGNHTHIKVIGSNDGGKTWKGPYQVDHGVNMNSNVFPWISAGGNGRVAIDWESAASDNWNDPSSNWSILYAQTNNFFNANPTFDESVVAPLNHKGDICTVGINCEVTMGNRNLADDLGIAVDPNGGSHMIWTDDTTGTSVLTTAAQTAGPLVRGPLAPPPPPVRLPALPNAGAVRGARLAALPNTGGPPPSPWWLLLLALPPLSVALSARGRASGI